MALIVKGGSSFDLTKQTLLTLYEWGSKGTDQKSPKISTLAGIFQRKSQTKTWTDNNNAKAKEYIVSLIYGTGLLETFILVPLDLLVEKVRLRASDDRYLDEQKTIPNQDFIEDDSIRNIWKDALDLIMEDVDKDVMFYLIDGQNRLNNALIPFRDNKWELRSKDGSEVVIQDDVAKVNHNINGVTYEDLPDNIKEMFDSIQVPVAIATRGDIDKLAEILIWKNEGLPWVIWQKVYTQRWYTKFRRQIESLVEDKLITNLLSKVGGVYHKDLDGVERLVADCLCFLNKNFFPSATDIESLLNFFDGKSEILNSEITSLKSYLRTLSQAYKDQKSIQINELRNYLMLMWSLKGKGYSSSLSMPSWRIEKDVSFASEYKTINKLLQTEKKSRSGKYWDLNWQDVKVTIGGKVENKVDHKPYGYVWANKTMGTDHNTARVTHLRDAFLEREDELIKKNVIVKMDTQMMSSIEEHYEANGRKDINGVEIDSMDLHLYHRGHNIPRADGGSNGLSSGNVKPQLKKDNLSIGRNEVPQC